MTRRISMLAFASLLVVGLAAGGCRPKDAGQVQDDLRDDAVERERRTAAEAPVAREIDSEPFDRDAVERDAVPEDAGGTAARLNESGVLQTIYFEFDSTDLGDAARRTLQRNADWLVGHPRWNVVVEGHCDERGTIEYNIALGDRRARAVRDYLSALGVSADRIRVVSYGEERPAEPGHHESAWSRNRRAEFVIEE